MSKPLAYRLVRNSPCAFMGWSEALIYRLNIFVACKTIEPSSTYRCGSAALLSTVLSAVTQPVLLCLAQAYVRLLPIAFFWP